MKKILKFFTLLLIVCSLVYMVGCKKKDKDNNNNENEVKIVSISVVQSSVPTSIIVTEVSEKLSNIKIRVNKSNDTVEEINLNKNMISTGDLSKLDTVGSHDIKITYSGFDTTLRLNIIEDTTQVEKVPITYTVNIIDIAGKPLSNFYVTFYDGEEIVADGYTKSTGSFTAELLPNNYEVVIEGREGYYLNQELYETDLIGTPIEIQCLYDTLDGVEADYGHIYELGDLVYDFTVYDLEGAELNLYDLLSEYKVVLLNFWYTTCSYCQLEFPYVVEAYESTYNTEDGETKYYSDDVCIIAVNPTIAGNGDSIEMMRQYRDALNISFYVAADVDADPSSITMEPALTRLFNIDSYPSTVYIDSYGRFAQFDDGAILFLEKWTQNFDKYISDEYTPIYSGSINGEIELEKPDITQEDSTVLENAINGTNYDGSKFECTYTPEDNKDKDYSWPWVVEEYDGKNCIKPSNQDKDPSFAIVYFTIELKAGEGIAFDYFCSTEDADKLYVTANGSILTYIAGQSPYWEKAYPFIAIEDGEYEFGLCYYKDSSFSMGDDAIYITNMRIISEEDIDEETYIYRECATGMMNEITMSYPNYVNVVYNETDGYYHVNSVDGPLLLADILSGTQWNNSTLYDICVEGKCIGYDGVDYNEIIKKYAVITSNSTIGYCPVTKELADALKQIVKALGHIDAQTNENQWLEVCVYYSTYGTNGVELGIPTYGVCYWEPITFDGDGYNTPATASANFDRIILPRGFIFGFTPSYSGVYKFYSTVESLETIGWICDSTGVAVQTNEVELRIFAEQSSKGILVDNNFVCYIYMEVGKTYLFRAGFYDVTEFSPISVAMEYVDEKVDLLTIASPGVFTTSDDEMTNVISGNYVDVEIGEDGFYHVVGSNAEDDAIYCDFIYINNITGMTLKDCLSDRFNAFNFTKDEFGLPLYDEEGYFRYTTLDEENNIVRQYVCVDAEGNEYYVNSVGEGEYTEENGYTYIKLQEGETPGYDFTDEVQAYLDEHLITDENSEVYGCVKVNERFARILWLLMNKYTFAGIEGSWLKLCYYYKYVGPTVNE